VFQPTSLAQRLIWFDSLSNVPPTEFVVQQN
jgi:hypothetical protein